MSTVATQPDLTSVQHLYLDGVSWGFYEQVLREIRNRPLRVTFDRGEIEIMSPLPEHENLGTCLGRLVETMSLERGIEVVGLGSTTFRDSAAEKGLEPDECYYVQNAEKVSEIAGAFDPAIHCPPDLAIEIEITRKAIVREPIYAALGVPELWHVSPQHIQCRILRPELQYQNADKSLAFPFLKPADLLTWARRLSAGKKTVLILREFQNWVRALVVL